jgi:hypothetical protein
MEFQKKTFSLDCYGDSMPQNTSIDILCQDRWPQSRLVSIGTGLEPIYGGDAEANEAAPTFFDFPVLRNANSEKSPAECDFHNALCSLSANHGGNTQGISDSNQIENEHLKGPYQTVTSIPMRSGLSISSIT